MVSIENKNSVCFHKSSWQLLCWLRSNTSKLQRFSLSSQNLYLKIKIWFHIWYLNFLVLIWPLNSSLEVSWNLYSWISRWHIRMWSICDHLNIHCSLMTRWLISTVIIISRKKNAVHKIFSCIMDEPSMKNVSFTNYKYSGKSICAMNQQKIFISATYLFTIYF